MTATGPSTPKPWPPAPTSPRGPGARGARAGPRPGSPRLRPRGGGGGGAARPPPLAARRDLARCTGRLGDAAGARDQFAALLPIVERVLGADHPATLDARRE